MENLQKPYLTVIGNHDYSSNGGEIYMKMFGDYNYASEGAVEISMEVQPDYCVLNF